MTCIVGLKKEGSVYLGGDSAGVSGYNVRIRQDKKVFRLGEFIFGFTTSFRMGQILQYSFAPPPHMVGSDFEYLCTEFINEVIYWFNKCSYTEKKSDSGGTFLLGYNGGLYTIQSDFQVSEVIDDYTAVGCGEAYALGAMRNSLGNPVERVTQALETAAYFSSAVAAPFNIVSIPE